MNSTYCVQDSGSRTACGAFSSVKTAPEGPPSFDTDANCDPRRWPVSGSGLRAGHSEARTGLVFPSALELIIAKGSPSLFEAHNYHVDLPPVGGCKRPLPTRQALCLSGPSPTLRFLSYAVHGATPTGGSAFRGRPPTPTPPPPLCVQRLLLDPRQH